MSTSEKQPTPREEMEMRITALLMGELSPEEKVALETLVAADPALAALQARLRKAMALLREASTESEAPVSETLVQLSSERRARLLAHFKTPAPASPSPAITAPIVKKPRRDWAWAVHLGLAATVLAFVGVGLLMPASSTVRSRAQPTRIREDRRIVDSAIDQYAVENGKVPAALTKSGRLGLGISSLNAAPPPSTYAGSYWDNPRSFAPADSRAPSINLFGTPRITNWAAPAQNAGSAAGTGVADLSGSNQLEALEEQKQPFATDVNGASHNMTINSGRALTLTGGNTFSGGTIVSQGNLALTSGGTVTAGSANIRAGGAGGTIDSLGSSAVNAGSIVLNQSAANTFGGNITLSPAPLAKDIEVTAGKTVLVDGRLNILGDTRSKDKLIRRESVNQADNGRIAGSGGVSKEGAGKLTFHAGALSFDAGVGNLSAPPSEENLTANRAGTAPSAALPQAQLLQNEFQWNMGRTVVPSNGPSPAEAKPTSSSAAGELALDESKKKEITSDTREPVKQLFIEAQGLYDTGRYSLAKQRAEQILKADSNNIVARRLEEKIDRAMSDYGVAAYNETRADALAKSDMAWARPIRQLNKQDPDRDGFANEGEFRSESESARSTALRRKLDSIVIPKLELNNMTVREALDYLKKKSVELDGTSPAGQRGANIVLKLGEADSKVAANPTEQPSIIPSVPGLDQPAAAAPSAGKPEDTRITVALNNVPLTEALKYVTGLANLKYKVEPYVVAVVPMTENTDVLLTKEWKIPAGLIPPAAGSDQNSPMDRETVKNWLIANGLSFNGTSSAVFIKKTNRLIVRNTQDQLDLVDNIVKAAADDEAAKATKAAPIAPVPQPEIQTSENAFSTFSLNVSDVSFKLAAASLEQGHMPDPASVRSEEFINAFNYRDPEPAPGAPLAFASERARYPFAQNRDLLRFAVKTAAAGRQAGRPLNIVLLLDKSGSMERADRVNIVREALRVLATQLQPQDKLSIVSFARTPRLWADGVAGDKVSEVIARVNEITPEGGTNLEAALDLGYETAHRHFTPDSVNRLVLFTDGAANLGDVNPDALTKKVEAQRKQGIALDCFGIGWEGYNDNLLEQLTRNADGRYGFINTPSDAASNFAAQLTGALQVAASDVKVQVEFNPRRVKAYRQIGYATHQLTKEQFRDNTVNAAQIGAAESGNALYVVEVDPRGEGDLATVHVRFRVPGTSDYREHEWPVPFTGDAQPLEQSSSALRLAGAASAFSEMLAASPYATEVTSDRLLNILNGVPPIYGADPRPTKLEWMIRQARSLSGR